MDAAGPAGDRVCRETVSELPNCLVSTAAKILPLLNALIQLTLEFESGHTAISVLDLKERRT